LSSPASLAVRHVAEGLDDHSKIALRAEVRNFDAGEVAAQLAAKDQVIPSFGLRRQRLIECRRGAGDVMNALSLLGKE